MPAINGGHRLSCCCAERRSCRRGGALCWECPARLCPAVYRMERVRATAGRPNRRRQTSPTHAMQVRWTRVPYTRPTPLSHPPERSHAPTCTRPNHTHMIVICRRTHPSHHHTPTRTCPGVNGHVDTHGGRLSSPARGIWQPPLSSAALAADGRRWRRSRSGGSAAAPGLVLEASEAQELAHSGLLVLLQDQPRCDRLYSS